jgi:hypothetical protein
MRSCVTNPSGEWPWHMSWSALRSFEVSLTSTDVSAGSESTDVSDGSDQPQEEAPVQMQPPVSSL